MEKSLQKIPFLRLLSFLVLGIVLSNTLPFNINFYSVIVYLVFVFIFLCFDFKLKIYLYQTYSFLLCFFFFLFGYTYANHINQIPEFKDANYFVATLQESPIKKKNSYKAFIEIKGLISTEKCLNAKEKVIAYFRTDSSVAELESGDRILFKGNINLIKNNGNPYEFDYKQYLARKHIYRQVFIGDTKWKILPSDSKVSIQILATRFREKLLAVYKNNNLEDEEFAILSALTLGYKDELNAEVKNVFSSAGAMHILAVSGLHVGIIFLIINFMFGFLRRWKYGRFIYLGISIFCLWSYAILTGMSPSVLRAATMFSFLIVGNNLKRPSNIYNTIAASAFFLLVLNPNLIFDVGFQLSYCAVVGIIFFQPKFYGLIKFNKWLPDKMWGLFTVSLAAQLSTFPFSIYYFHQFPTYAWLSNFIVIPAAFIFIYLGFSILILSQFQVISNVVGDITSLLVKLLFSTLKSIKFLPYYTISDIYINQVQLFILVGVIVLLMMYIIAKKSQYVKLIIICTCFFYIVNIQQNYHQHKRNEVIIYNAGKTKLIHLIDGKKNYILTDTPIDEKIQYLYKTVVLKKKLKTPLVLNLNENYSSSNLLITPGVISFNGINIVKHQTQTLPKEFNIHFQLNDKSRFKDNSTINKIISYNPSLKKRKLSSGIHCLKTEGAYLYHF